MPQESTDQHPDVDFRCSVIIETHDLLRGEKMARTKGAWPPVATGKRKSKAVTRGVGNNSHEMCERDQPPARTTVLARHEKMAHQGNRLRAVEGDYREKAIRK